MKTSMIIENEAQFTDWINGLINGASGDNLEDAAFAGASEIEVQVKNKITNIHLIDTANLKNSIEAKRGSYSDTEAEATTGTPVPYATIHEFGGIINNKNAWGKGIHATIHIPARPYMRPAVDEHVPSITDKVAQVIDMKLREANG